MIKTAHWVLKNGSGMHRVAESMANAEKVLGLDANLCDVQNSTDWDKMLDCDVHICHTHFPDELRKKVTKPLKVVWVGHGTPEHVFQVAVETGLHGGYGHADGWMLCQNWLRTADAIVTFWPRHQMIWKSLCDKATIVDCVPMGVDKSFWKKQPTKGKFSGEPSLFTCENAHYIKWPLDLFLTWPFVVPELKGKMPRLHVAYLPRDVHRYFFPLINRNGCSYSGFISPLTFSHNELLNAFNSIDYYIGLVRYGDFNRISLEANACGTKTISYAGNPYSDFWIMEGDQRDMAKQLISVLNGDIEPRKKEVVPDISETAVAMLKIYERILK